MAICRISSLFMLTLSAPPPRIKLPRLAARSRFWLNFSGDTVLTRAGMNRFLQALANLFRVEELRKRVLFTLALLAVYRIGAHIPTPGINSAVLDQIFSQAAGTALGIFDLFSGGNFRRLTISALGIMPYITSSLILQLMTVVFPYLERLQKEGELGRRKITQYTRYLTVALSIIQSLSIATTLQHATGPNNQSFVYNPGIGFTLMTVLTLTTGSRVII